MKGEVDVLARVGVEVREMSTRQLHDIYDFVVCGSGSPRVFVLQVGFEVGVFV